jgi:uncharacterized protein (DUF983 family)
MLRCRTCGRQIGATARICRNCGALTGENMRSDDEPVVRVLGFSAAAVIAFFVFLFLKWLGLLM